MNGDRNSRIYLTGFMGSGKSTIAPILANTLGFTHVDIDREIENVTDKKISEIFSELGEEYFRDIERSVLLEVSQRKDCVISLGGGTIINNSILHIVKSSGILIYLKTSTEQIYKRLKYKTDRPLIKSPQGASLSQEQLNESIYNLLSKREHFYEQADLTISTNALPVGQTVDNIVHELKKILKWKRAE